jgi:hypothetical protein
MKVKQVYANDTLVGEAATWAAVYLLLSEKGVSFVGAPDAAEGPAAFFLRGEVAKPDSSRSKLEIGTPQGMPPIHSVACERARAITRGLIKTERSAGNPQLDSGMLRLECLRGGYYWISLDGRHVLRGKSHSEAADLDPKFIEVMERAGR